MKAKPTLERKSFPIKSLKLFFGGFGPKVQVKIFSSYFSRFGKVKAISLIRDKGTGHSKGFGFVRMNCVQAINSIIESCPHIVDGMLIDVQKASVKKTTLHLNKPSAGNSGLFIGGLPCETTKSTKVKRGYCDCV